MVCDTLSPVVVDVVQDQSEANRWLYTLKTDKAPWEV